MNVEFEVSDFIPASPDQVYSAWLDSDEHSAMTGGHAMITDQIGGTFEAWDAYFSPVKAYFETKL